VSFKASKNTNIRKEKSSDNSNDDSDIEAANFVRRLQRGTRKYKGMIPFKCLNCSGVGHFSAKFSHNKNRDNKGQDKFNPNERRKGKIQRNKYFQKQKKNLYSKEDYYSSSESDEEVEDNILFMVQETKSNEDEDIKIIP
jgi:hypothetical protein